MTSVLNDTLKSFDYYKSKLPLYLQNSYGFVEHFKIWHELMMSQVEVSDTIHELLNVFDSNYLAKIAALPDADIPEQIIEPTDIYGRSSDILDKLGSLFGITRKFSVSYYDENMQHVVANLNLNNFEFLTLLKIQIVRSHFDGSYDNLRQFYAEAGLQTFVVSDVEHPANSCFLYLALTVDSENEYSDNIKHMFRSGLLLIPSMGIQYIPAYVDLTHILLWDVNEPNVFWDEGRWA